MTRVRTLSDVLLTAFYYQQIREALGRAKRLLFPEHTEDDGEDPIERLLDLYALVGHRDAVLLDHAARELGLPTATLRASFVVLGALVDYRLAYAAPATVELLLELSTPPGAPATLVAEGDVFVGTAAGGGEVPFEAVAALSADGPAAWVVVEDDGGTETVRALPYAVLGGSIDAGDALYIGHPDLLFDELVLELSALPEDAEWTVEYAEGIRTIFGSAVGVVGGSIRIGLDPREVVIGTTVVVTCLRTSVSAEVVVENLFTALYVDVPGTMGQSIVSTDPGDYAIRPLWSPVPGRTIEVVGAAGLSLAWDLPDTIDRRWEKRTVGGTSAFFVRVRFYSSTGGSIGTLEGLDAGAGTWFARVSALQGETTTESLGVSDGSASQVFALPAEGGIFSLERLVVGGEEWVRVEDLLDASTFDRVFAVVELPDGSLEVLFGDGVRGRIPTDAAEIVATIRTGGARDGNLGARAIDRARGASGPVASVTNPRPASGYLAREGETAADRELLRFRIPKRIRTGDRVVNGPDAEVFAERFRLPDGRVPVARAVARENGSGEATIRLVCVGPGGAIPTAEDLAEIGVALNGRRRGAQRIGGVGVQGTIFDPVPYVPRTIDVDLELSIDARFALGAQEAAEAVLDSTLRPLARRLELRDDSTVVEGADFQWSAGGEVALLAIVARLGISLRGFLDAAWTTPAADVALEADELPVLGTVAVSIVEVTA